MNLMSAVRGSPVCGEDTRRNLAPRKMRPQSSIGLGEKYQKAQKNSDKASLYSPIEARATPAPTSESPKKREFVVDSGASVFMLSKKVLSSDDMKTLRRSRIPTTVVTANGEVQTNEEAQVHVHDLDLFVTVRLLEDTLAVLSLGKLCEEHGYIYEWASGQKPRLTKQGKNILCKTENFVPLVVLGLSSNSGTGSSSTSPPQDSSSTSSSPASERRDEPAPGNWRDSPNKLKQNQKEGHQSSNGRPNARPSRMVFTYSLEDAEVPAPAHISHDSDSERSTKVALRKHSVYIHSPKDRNCEVCLRTKMTKAPCRRRTGEAVPRAEKFGDLITADHKVFNEEGESGHNHRYPVVVQDLTT